MKEVVLMKKVLGVLVSLSLFLSMSGLPLAAEAPPGPGEPAVKADDTAKKSSPTKKKSTKKKKKSTKKKTSSKKKSSTPKQQPATQPAGQ
jgi:outer membrane biosynthesis protein TonB